MGIYMLASHATKPSLEAIGTVVESLGGCKGCSYVLAVLQAWTHSTRPTSCTGGLLLGLVSLLLVSLAECRRDLKCSNVMVAEGCLAKVSDLGCARVKQHRMTMHVGTPEFQAPEMKLLCDNAQDAQ